MIATIAGIALAVGGTAAVAVAISGQQPAPPKAPSSADTNAPDRAEDPDSSARAPDTRLKGETESGGRDRAENTADELDWSEPTRIRIPRFDITSALEELQLDSNGVMQTPQDPAKAGWFTPAPPPGLTGTSVIAGHVTWDRKPAVFFRLADLRKGDKVNVDRQDGITAVFEVTRIGEFPRDSFPTKAVYGQVHHAGLRLITCGGVYDETTNTYGSNIIIWAKMTTSHPTRN